MSGHNVSISNPCCCVTYRDAFDRSELNPAGWKRWQEITATQNSSPYTYYLSFTLPWSNSPSAWSISGGKAVCSTSGAFLKGYSTSSLGSVPFSPPFSAWSDSEFEYDLRFSGSGQVHFWDFNGISNAASTIFDYSANKIRYYFLDYGGHTTPVDADWYNIPFTFSSGTTYRILQRSYSTRPAHIDNPSFTGQELWIDGVKVKKGWGLSRSAMGFFGSGTLEISDYNVRRMYNTEQKNCTSNCHVPAKCSFPWPDDSAPQTLPPQIQLDLAAITSGCSSSCPGGFYGSFINSGGTYVLDAVTPTAYPYPAGDSIFKSSLPCAQYEVDASFVCYTKLTIKFYAGQPGAYAGFSMQYSEPVASYSPMVYEFTFDANVNERAFLEMGTATTNGKWQYKGDTISLPAASLGTVGTCRFTQLDITPLY